MSEIRSVSVHLDADVAGYIAKMKLAGEATDKAFGNSSRSIDTTNRGLANTDTNLRKVDTSARKAETSVSSLERTMSRASNNGGFSKATSDLDKFASKLGILPGLAVAGSAALIPLAGAAAGVAAAFAAPLAFAGGGLTLFAVLGGFAVKDTNKQLKAIDALEKKLGTLQKGTKDYAVAQAQLRDAQKALSPAQREYADSLDHMSTAFHTFLSGKSGEELIGPIAQAINLGADLLPKVEPIIGATSRGLTTLLDDLDRFSKTNEFSAFVHDVSAQIGPDLIGFGHILGGFTHGIGDLLVLTGKRLSPEFMHGLEQIASDFERWATSRGARRDVQSFIRYLHEVGPDVASTIGSVAHGLERTVEALAPLGPPTLHVVKGIADAISSIPTPVLTALAGATIGLSVLGKTGTLKAVGGGVNRLTGGAGIAGGLIGKTSVVPVLVTNWPPGFVGGGGGKGGPGALGTGAAATAAETAAAAKAAEAAAAVKAAGGTRAEIAAATGKAFKEAMAAAEAAGETAFIRGMPAFAKIGGASGLLRTVLGAPGFVTSGDIGAEAVKPHFANERPDGSLPTRIPRSFAAPGSEVALGAMKAGNALDSLRARAAKASHEVDQIGPHAKIAFSGAAHSVVGLNDKLDGIKSAQANQQMDLLQHTAAAALGAAGSKVDGFKGKLASIPSNKSVKVTANTGNSLSQVRAIAAELAQLHSKTVTVTVAHATGGRLVGLGSADGSTIPKTGMGYADRHLRLLADGEEVISNRYGQADRNRPLLKAINAGRMANGGTVSTSASSTPARLVMDGRVGHEADGVRHRLHDLQLALKDSTQALNDDKAARQALIQKRQALVSTVQGGFRNDIFAQPTSAWGQATNPFSVLRTDIRGARKYDNLIGRLRRRGLSGGALGEVTTLADAQQVANYSPAQLHRLSRLYDERQRASHTAATDLGDARFGAEIAKATKVAQAQAADVHRLTQQIAAGNRHLAAIEKAQQHHAADHAKALNGATSTGTRRARRP